jgi:tetratricopeptide (TPR) repeat protein
MKFFFPEVNIKIIRKSGLIPRGLPRLKGSKAWECLVLNQTYNKFPCRTTLLSNNAKPKDTPRLASGSVIALLFFIGVLAGFSSLDILFAQAVEHTPSQPAQHLIPVQTFTTPAQTQAPSPVQTQVQVQEQTQPAVQPAQQRPQAQRQTGSDALQNYRIGRDLEARNRFDEANNYYNEAVRICMDELNRNSANMDSYTVLTWTLLRQRRYSEVINWGDRALRVNPGDFRIVETMGEAYFYLNDYEHSLIMMQRYVAYMPRGDRASTAYFFMGEIYRNQRKYLHADIAYTTAVTLEGSMFIWWYRLGIVREAAGEYESASAAYERSVILNPASREASDALERTKKLFFSSQR